MRYEELAENAVEFRIDRIRILVASLADIIRFKEVTDNFGHMRTSAPSAWSACLLLQDLTSDEGRPASRPMPDLVARTRRAMRRSTEGRKALPKAARRPTLTGARLTRSYGRVRKRLIHGDRGLAIGLGRSEAAPAPTAIALEMSASRAKDGLRPVPVEVSAAERKQDRWSYWIRLRGEVSNAVSGVAERSACS